MDEIITRSKNYTSELEYYAIGAICIEPEALKHAGGLVADDFTIVPCREIYRAAMEAYVSGKPFDAALATVPIQDKVENPAEFVAKCMEATGGTIWNFETHAAMIHMEAELRRLKSSAWNAIQSCDDGMELAATLMQACRDHMTGKSGKMRSMLELMDEAADTLFEGKQPKRVDTGFPKLDSLLMGLRPGNLVILAARPGVGKSAFAQDIAENVARRGQKTVIYSMEMKGDELSERWISKASAVSMNSILRRQFNPDEVRRVSDGCNVLSTLPIFVCDESNVSPERIRRDMINMDGVELVIVDYVGLMESGAGKKGYENRNLELGAISRGLKKLAVELNIPILMLSQLNREIDDKTQPELRHLRDSGELEQNANKILFLWNIDEDERRVGVSVAKNRQGRKGVVQMIFDSEHMAFAECAYDVDIPKDTKERKRRRWDDKDD